MTWTEIGTVTLGSAAASVTFSTGLSTYKFFRLTGYVLNDANAKQVFIRFNADSGSNYPQQRITADSTTVAGARSTQTSVEAVTGTQMSASQAGSFSIIIAKPAAGVKGQVIEQAGYNTSPFSVLQGAEWNNTADVISSITVSASSNNFAAGTSWLLEGLAF